MVQNEELYGVQKVEVVNDLLVIDVGYAEFENDFEEVYDDNGEFVDSIDYFVVSLKTEDLKYKSEEFYKDGFKEKFLNDHLNDMYTYKYVFEKENNNYILVNFYKSLYE